MVAAIVGLERIAWGGYPSVAGGREMRGQHFDLTGLGLASCL